MCLTVIQYTTMAPGPGSKQHTHGSKCQQDVISGDTKPYTYMLNIYAIDDVREYKLEVIYLFRELSSQFRQNSLQVVYDLFIFLSSHISHLCDF